MSKKLKLEEKVFTTSSDLLLLPSFTFINTVIAFSKKTGDYAVLSPPDLSVLALAYSIEVQAHGTWRIRDEVGGPVSRSKIPIHSTPREFRIGDLVESLKKKEERER